MSDLRTTKNPETLKYRVNLLLSIFSSAQQSVILEKIKKAGVSEFVLNRVRRTQSDDKYSPAHDQLLVMSIVLKQYNPVFKKQLNIEINSVDDLKNNI